MKYYVLHQSIIYKGGFEGATDFPHFPHFLQISPLPWRGLGVDYYVLQLSPYYQGYMEVLFSFSQIQICFTLVDRMYKAKNKLNNCPIFVAPTNHESIS